MLENTLVDRTGTAAPTRRRRSPFVRSAVSNNKRLFVEGAGKSAWARRYRDLLELHADDLGGASMLSEAQHSLIRRVATLEIELERLEGRLSEGNDVDLEVYGRTASHLRRMLETLGIERAKRDVTPALSDYVASLTP
jgi:hypothetical protein